MGGFFGEYEGRGSDAEAFVALLELGQAAAAVEQRLLAAGPGRMRGRVDVEVQRVTLLAPGRAGLVLGAVGHDDLDRVVVGMRIGFHRLYPGSMGDRACGDVAQCQNLKPRPLGATAFEGSG